MLFTLFLPLLLCMQTMAKNEYMAIFSGKKSQSRNLLQNGCSVKCTGISINDLSCINCYDDSPIIAKREAENEHTIACDYCAKEALGCRSVCRNSQLDHNEYIKCGDECYSKSQVCESGLECNPIALGHERKRPARIEPRQRTAKYEPRGVIRPRKRRAEIAKEPRAKLAKSEPRAKLDKSEPRSRSTKIKRTSTNTVCWDEYSECVRDCNPEDIAGCKSDCTGKRNICEEAHFQSPK